MHNGGRYVDEDFDILLSAARKVVTLVRDHIPARFGLDAICDVQVLCPMNCGGVGEISFKVALQAALNPPGGEKIARFGSRFWAGDKVTQVVNDCDRNVFNGDLGIVARVDMEAGELVATFDGREENCCEVAT